MRYCDEIDGVSCDLRFMRFEKRKIGIRITADKLGATLSLSDGEQMLTIPLEKVEALEIKEIKK